MTIFWMNDDDRITHRAIQITFACNVNNASKLQANADKRYLKEEGKKCNNRLNTSVDWKIYFTPHTHIHCAPVDDAWIKRCYNGKLWTWEKKNKKKKKSSGKMCVCIEWRGVVFINFIYCHRRRWHCHRHYRNCCAFCLFACVSIIAIIIPSPASTIHIHL